MKFKVDYAGENFQRIPVNNCHREVHLRYCSSPISVPGTGAIGCFIIDTTYHPLFHWIQQLLRPGFLKVIYFRRKTNAILIQLNTILKQPKIGLDFFVNQTSIFVIVKLAIFHYI